MKKYLYSFVLVGLIASLFQTSAFAIDKNQPVSNEGNENEVQLLIKTEGTEQEEGVEGEVKILNKEETVVGEDIVLEEGEMGITSVGEDDISLVSEQLEVEKDQKVISNNVWIIGMFLTSIVGFIVGLLVGKRKK